MSESNAEQSERSISDQVREVFKNASPAASAVIVQVIEIERQNQHLNKPHVTKDIERAILAAVKEEQS